MPAESCYWLQTFFFFFLITLTLSIFDKTRLVTSYFQQMTFRFKISKITDIEKYLVKLDSLRSIFTTLKNVDIYPRFVDVNVHNLWTYVYT
jgi:hypothetical protein